MRIFTDTTNHCLSGNSFVAPLAITSGNLVTIFSSIVFLRYQPRTPNGLRVGVFTHRRILSMGARIIRRQSMVPFNISTVRSLNAFFIISYSIPILPHRARTLASLRVGLPVPMTGPRVYVASLNGCNSRLKFCFASSERDYSSDDCPPSARLIS